MHPLSVHSYTVACQGRVRRGLARRERPCTARSDRNIPASTSHVPPAREDVSEHVERIPRRIGEAS